MDRSTSTLSHYTCSEHRCCSKNPRPYTWLQNAIAADLPQWVERQIINKLTLKYCCIDENCTFKSRRKAVHAHDVLHVDDRYTTKWHENASKYVYNWKRLWNVWKLFPVIDTFMSTAFVQSVHFVVCFP